ncbi:MAG: cobyric acid synthase [Lachnospiraceae bacterium]|nr:cobyric acid synthase [Lachnospiraceae bacterium]
MAKVIMIQGTMSNVGKSFITAGLCRIFRQDGYSVAPFKSQNMALNSYVTKENLEIGRAQAMQAEAAGVEPVAAMNPILLKPTSDMGSQVIVNGEVVGNMQAVDYFKKKRDYLPVIRQAYDTLDRQHDIIVVEGAGSPAEINLKQDDIVNMGVARMLGAPVILVGDIDRGGVFAQLIGTVMLLEPEERELVCGLLINKFRGDRSILEPGITMLEDRCKKEVLGVIPFEKLELDEEDSLADSLNRHSGDKVIDVAVIRFPKISNFTDFQALSMEDSLSVRYVENPSRLGEPDVVILPGTKNTIQDLIWFRESGLETAVSRLASGDRAIVVGICGGYQMLGTSIADTCGVEGGGTIRGMGLLPVKTYFEPEKTRTRAAGRLPRLTGCFEELSGKKLTGYEIHMGRTYVDQSAGNGGCTEGMFKLEEEACDNSLSEENHIKDRNSQHQDMELCDGCFGGNVMGSYLHGIFDADEFRKAFVRLLRKRKGLFEKQGEQMTFQQYKQTQYDKLADMLRRNVDMKRIYEIMGISGKSQ